MSPRLFCNLVLAWLMSLVAGEEDGRKKMEQALYAPLEGAEAVQARFLSSLGMGGGD